MPSTLERDARALAFSAALILCALNARAATGSLEEVVVSAARIQQSSFEVAAADTTIKTENSTALGVNLSDYLGSMAGIAVRDRQNYAQDQQLSIRGFGARAQFGIVGVRLFVDGIPATMPDGQAQSSHFDFDAAERIEVLRGPYSVLYGNAAGGVVQIFTARGTDRDELRASVQGGTADTWRASFNARGKTGPLAYNFDYTHFNTDGWRDHSKAHRDLGNLRLDFTPFSGNQLMLVANRLSSPESQDNGSLTLAQFNADPQQAAPTSLQFNTRKSLAQTQFGLSDEQRLSDRQSLHLSLYSGERTVTQFLSTPLAAQTSALSPGGVVDLSNRYYGANAYWSFDADLLGRPLSLVAGASGDALNSRRRGYNNFNGAVLGVFGALRRDEINLLHDFDQYAQAEWRLSQRWSASLGLRHNHVRFESDDHFITASNPNDSGSLSFAAWNPAASALYRLSEQLHLYGAYGRALDTPTFDNLAYRPDGSSGLNFGLRAARTRNFELGAKWRSETLASRIALFRSDTDNDIAVASAQGGRSTYRNVGRTKRQGAEAELEFALAPKWRWQFAYTWLDATYRDRFQTCASTTCSAATGIVIPAGNLIPGIARSTLFGSLRWGADSGPYVAIEGSYLSQVAADDANTQYAGAYGLAGLNGGYTRESPRWREQVFARIDNVLDRRYASAVVVDDANGRYYQPGAGRSFYLGFNLAWRERHD